MIGSLATRAGKGITGSRQLGRRFAIAGTLAICASVPGIALNTSHGEAGTGASADSRRGPYGEGSLELFGSGRIEQYRRAVTGAEGFAGVPFQLWVYEDPRGRPCAANITGEPPGARRLMTAVPVEGSFRERRRFKPTKRGKHTFCGYLGPDSGTVVATSFKVRRVLKPLLRPGKARGTVQRSLRRHDFANNVVEKLETNCRRRDRSKFSCRFSSAFPGYSLKGRGKVKLARRISYRFRLRVQGETVVLTDENEGRFPG
jgi:hypothetical protein